MKKITLQANIPDSIDTLTEQQIADMCEIAINEFMWKYNIQSKNVKTARVYVISSEE